MNQPPRRVRTALPSVVLCLVLLATACRGGDDASPTAAAPQDTGVAADADGDAAAAAAASEAPPASEQPSAAEPTEDDDKDGGADLELPAGPPTEGLPGGRYARINSIAVDGDRYAVDWEPFNFAPLIGPGPEDFHVHFFFDDVAPENAGTNGPSPGSWDLYDGGSPYTGMSLASKPASASQLCVLVADANHAVTVGTGNCMPVPA